MLLYQITQIHQEEAIPAPMSEDQQDHRIGCKVEIPLITNVTNAIHRLEPGGRFDLKKNIVQLLHIVGNLQAYHIRIYMFIYITFLRLVILLFALESPFSM